MRTPRLACRLSAGLVLLAAAPAAADRWVFTTLPGHSSWSIGALSANGRFAVLRFGGLYNSRTERWTPGGAAEAFLPASNAETSVVALDIANDGSAVGTRTGNYGAHNVEPLFWDTPGRPTVLALPDGDTSTTASAMCHNGGPVFGLSRGPSVTRLVAWDTPSSPPRILRTDQNGNGFTIRAAGNDGTMLASDNAPSRRLLRFQPTDGPGFEIPPAPDVTYMSMQAVSPEGRWAAARISRDEQSQVMLIDTRTREMTPLAVPPGASFAAVSAMSRDTALIIGNAYYPVDGQQAHTSRPFVWIGGVPVELTEILTAEITGGNPVTYPDAVSADGRMIAGHSPITGPWAARLLPGCAADVNHDGWIDFFDLDQFLEAFQGGFIDADVDGDWHVDAVDLSAFLDAFINGCP